MKRPRLSWFLPGIFVIAVLAIGFLLGRIGSSGTSERPAPIVLKQVRDLGELHLIEHQYQTVMTMESHKDAAEWTQSVPVIGQMADSLVTAATRNEALVSVQGSVEAGVDLSQASIDYSASELTIMLPRAKLYPANVRAELHSQKRAIGWDDRNLGLKAEREAARRFEASSVRGGILEAAESRAITQVSDLFKAAGVKSVRVEFVSG